jgi:hypothetical protein
VRDALRVAMEAADDGEVVVAWWRGPQCLVSLSWGPADEGDDVPTSCLEFYEFDSDAEIPLPDGGDFESAYSDATSGSWSLRPTGPPAHDRVSVAGVGTTGVLADGQRYTFIGGVALDADVELWFRSGDVVGPVPIQEPFGGFLVGRPVPPILEIGVQRGPGAPLLALDSRP